MKTSENSLANLYIEDLYTTCTKFLLENDNINVMNVGADYVIKCCFDLVDVNETDILYSGLCDKLDHFLNDYKQALIILDGYTMTLKSGEGVLISQDKKTTLGEYEDYDSIVNYLCEKNWWFEHKGDIIKHLLITKAVYAYEC